MKKIYIYIIILCIGSFSLEGQKFHVDTIIWSGTSDNRANLVILGDGYRIDELDKYDQDAIDLSEYFLSKKPINNYNNYFNVISIRVPSNESGAALDPSMLIDNYFGSSYNVADIERLLVPTKNSKVRNVLIDNFPEFDIVVMVVNHSKYGGSGGWIATTSINTRAPEIVVHELGHSFGRLRDEYWAGPQFARESANMTKETNPDSVIWSNWYGDNNIGIYAFSEDPNWHRPHNNCKMRRLGVEFCSVCKEALVERIHSIVNGIDSWAPTNLNVNIKDKDSIDFKVDLVYPDPNTLNINWLFNSKNIVINNPRISLQFDSIPEGESILEAIVLDTTLYSRQDGRINRLSWVKWTIVKELSTNIFSTYHNVSYKFWPNPVDNELHLFTDKEGKGSIISLDGKLIKEFNFDKGSTAIEITSFTNTLILILNFDGKIVRHKLLKPSLH